MCWNSRDSFEQGKVHEHASASTVRALIGKVGEQTLADALTRHFNKSQLRNLEHLCARLVSGQSISESVEHLAPVFADLHVDEIDNDDAANVAQTELAGNLVRRFEIVVKDSGLEVRVGCADILPGVDVDDGERFGVFDDQRTAGTQPHLAIERLVQLLVQVEPLVDR